MIQADTSDLSRKSHSAADADLSTRFEIATYSQISTALTESQLTGYVESFIAKLCLEAHERCPAGLPTNGKDLYQFLFDLHFPALMHSFFGPQLLHVAPSFASSFREFDVGVGALAKHVPRWWKSKPYTAREDCMAALKSWKQTIPSIASCQTSEQIKQTFGFRVAWDRQQLFEKIDAMTPEAVACEELAFIWGASANTISTAFWILLKLMKSPGVRASFLARLNSYPPSRDAETGFQICDTQKLAKDPWMQSFFAEVMRLYVTPFVMRAPTKDLRLRDWILPAGQSVLLCPAPHERVAAVYSTQSETGPKSLGMCWPERFLSWDAQGKEVFKPARTSWSGFGGGSNLCPGRMFARQQILAVVPVLVGNYELELVGPLKAKPDWRTYGSGSLSTKGLQPFRLHGKGSKAERLDMRVTL